jgi:micrococcal nuclease
MGTRSRRRFGRWRAPLVAGLMVAVGATATLALVAAAGGGRPAPARDPPMVVVPNATVEDVIDGDTVVARVDGRDEHVRLIGIDTPETVDANRPVMCFGPEASAETHRLLADGTPVRLVRDVEARDVYGRLLAYVYRATDGTFVNLALAEGGFADVLAIAPNTTHGDELHAAVADAKRARRGLWAACRSFGQPVGSIA